MAWVKDEPTSEAETDESIGAYQRSSLSKSSSVISTSDRQPRQSLPAQGPWSDKEKKFQCPMCKKLFSVYTSLYRHSRYECGQQPRFGCYYCNYRTKQTTSVYQHVRRMHQGCEPACVDVIRGKIVKRRSYKYTATSSSALKLADPFVTKE